MKLYKVKIEYTISRRWVISHSFKHKDYDLEHRNYDLSAINWADGSRFWVLNGDCYKMDPQVI